MAERLVVDVDGLEALAATLESIRQRLDATRSVIRAVQDDVGSGDVWSALDHFENHWDDGRGRLDENAKNLAATLRDSAAVYRDTDEQLATDVEQAMNG